MPSEEILVSNAANPAVRPGRETRKPTPGRNSIAGSSAVAVAYSTSLEGFFRPRAVAAVGATERPESVGRTLLWNLVTSPFGGAVFPVNPGRKSVLGIRAYENVSAIGEPVDLAVIATAAPTVPGVMEDCARAGVRNAIVMSAFRDAGRKGLDHEAEALSVARRNGIRVLGPNSLGVMVPRTGLNATVTAGRAKAGRVGVVSQSGTMCSAILDWGEKANVGFSIFVSIGDMMDVNWGDLIYYLGDDPDTRCIVLYMETIGAPKAFLSATREVSLHKPIVVIKGRRSGAATHADPSLAEPDEVFDAALKRSAVLRVATIEELFSMAEVLGRQPLPKGRKLAILTNAGGPAVLATDSLISEGGQLAALSEKTQTALDKVLPSHWSGGNPVAGLGEALEETYPKAIEILAKDPGVDGILVVLTPKPSISARTVAEKVAEAARPLRVPLLTSWMGGEAVATGRNVLRDAGIPCFLFPDTAASIFNYMWSYRDNLNSLYETPHPVAEWEFHENKWVRETLSDLVRRTREEGRVFLTDAEARKVLEAYGIPVLRAVRATTADEAVEKAREVGCPVSLEALVRVPPVGPESRLAILSEVSDYRESEGRGPERIVTPEEAGRAYKLIEQEVTERFAKKAFGGVDVRAMPDPEAHSLVLGCDVDRQFGPVLSFGAGGWLGGLYGDRAVGLPPLNTNLARKLMEQTRIFRAMRDVARIAPHISQLETVLIRFSQLVLDQPLIREIRIDPLLVGPKGVHAGEVKMVLMDEGAPPRVRPAIRPYPGQYVRSATTRDGSTVTMRPIRPEDEPKMVAFHRRLSDQTIYNRYFGYLQVDQRTRHESLSRECFIDYDRNLLMIMEQESPGEAVVGAGRLIRIRGTNDGEFALMIQDDLQGQGLGKMLLSHLIAIAQTEGMGRIVGHVLEDNSGMLGLCERMGFSIKKKLGEDIVEASLNLQSDEQRR